MAQRTPQISFDAYDAGDSDEAMEIETRSAQGRAYRLRFARPYFHRRAENYAKWQLMTARLDGRLVGVCGGALKPVVFEGRHTTGLFLFDIRVAPEVRRRGVARQLVDELVNWSATKAEIGYAYAIGDNDAVARLAQNSLGAAAAPACSYLVFPTYKATGRAHSVESVAPTVVHELFLEREGPFGLYSDPRPAFTERAFIGSWLSKQGTSAAGCSAWSNEGILAEVVERLPRPLSALGAVLQAWPLNHLPTPHIPKAGERLRSWYIFDFYASGGAAAAALMDHVAAEARVHGIDYCYIIHRRDRAWVRALRKQFARPFAPIIPYSVMGRTVTGEGIRINAPYIDIRDV